MLLVSTKFVRFTVKQIEVRLFINVYIPYACPKALKIIIYISIM